jgi:hypothetical protein
MYVGLMLKAQRSEGSWSWCRKKRSGKMKGKLDETSALRSGAEGE